MSWAGPGEIQATWDRAEECRDSREGKKQDSAVLLLASAQRTAQMPPLSSSELTRWWRWRWRGEVSHCLRAPCEDMRAYVYKYIRRRGESLPGCARTENLSTGFSLLMSSWEEWCQQSQDQPSSNAMAQNEDFFLFFFKLCLVFKL